MPVLLLDDATDAAVQARKDAFSDWLNSQQQNVQQTVQSVVQPLSDEVAQRRQQFDDWLQQQNAQQAPPQAAQPTPDQQPPQQPPPAPIAVPTTTVGPPTTDEAQQRSSTFDDWLNQRTQPVGQAVTSVVQTAQDLAGGAVQATPPAPPARPGGQDSSYVFPIPGFSGPIQDHWGSVLGGSDLMAPRGTPVVAMRGGKVLESGYNSVGGNAVLVQGDDGNQYYYAHFDQAPDVKIGDNIQAGTPLGVVGNTGDAAGGPAHLHIGIGPDIKLGADKYGGTGGDYDAVGLLRRTLDNSANASAASVTPTSAAATQTTPELSGGGPSGGLTDRAQQILGSAADAARAFGGDAAKAVQAVLVTEGGLNNARGDNGESAGPLQFYGGPGGGQLNALAAQLGMSLDAAKQWVEQNPQAAVQWALGTPDNPGYLGRAIEAGQRAGLSGADLATYIQRNGQVSVSPERAGQNFNSLFGQGQNVIGGAARGGLDTLGQGAQTVADRAQQLATASGQLVSSTGQAAQLAQDQLQQTLQRIASQNAADDARARATRQQLLNTVMQPADGFTAPVTDALDTARTAITQNNPLRALDALGQARDQLTAAASGFQPPGPGDVLQGILNLPSAYETATAAARQAVQGVPVLGGLANTIGYMASPEFQATPLGAALATVPIGGADINPSEAETALGQAARALQESGAVEEVPAAARGVAEEAPAAAAAAGRAAGEGGPAALARLEELLAPQRVAVEAPAVAEELRAAPVVATRAVPTLESSGVDLGQTLAERRGPPGVSFEAANVGGETSSNLANLVLRDAQGEPLGLLQMSLAEDGQPRSLALATGSAAQARGVASELFGAARSAGLDLQPAVAAAERSGTLSPELANVARQAEVPVQAGAAALRPALAEVPPPSEPGARGPAGAPPGEARPPAAEAGGTPPRPPAPPGAPLGGAPPPLVGPGGATAVPRVLGGVLGGVSGGVAGNVSTPEGATPIDRAMRIVLGATAGTAAGLALPGLVSGGLGSLGAGPIPQQLVQQLRTERIPLTQSTLPTIVDAGRQGWLPRLADVTKQLILSNPATHVGNVIGGTLELLRSPLALTVAGRPLDAVAGINAVARAIPEASQNAWAALNGMQVATLGTRASRIPLSQPVYRVLGAADTFLRTLGEYQGIAERASQLLARAGVSASDPRAAEVLQAHAAELANAGRTQGGQSVFQAVKDNVSGLNYIDQLARKYAAFKEGLLNAPDLKSQALGVLLDFEVPFAGVPAKLLEVGVARTPGLAQASALYSALKAGRAGDIPQMQRAIGQMMVETSLQTLIAKGIQDGNIVGPDNPDHPGGAIRIGDQWFNFDRMAGGFALPMQIMAGFAEAVQKSGIDYISPYSGDRGALDRLAQQAAAGLNAAMKPFASAVPGQQLMSVLSAIGDGGITGVVQQQAQDTIARVTQPGFARFMENLTDPVAREIQRKGPDSLWQPTAAVWPGLAEAVLPPKIDPTTGQPMPRSSSGLGQLIGAENPHLSWLTQEANNLRLKYGLTVQPPSAYPDQVRVGASVIPLSPAEQHAVAQLSGQRLQQITERLQTPAYAALPPVQRALILQNMIRAADASHAGTVAQVLGPQEFRQRLIQGRMRAGGLVTPQPQFEAPFSIASGQHVLEQLQGGVAA